MVYCDYLVYSIYLFRNIHLICCCYSCRISWNSVKRRPDWSTLFSRGPQRSNWAPKISLSSWIKHVR